MFTQKNALARAKEFLAECTKLPVKIDRAILFGSFANGKPNENSDIDLALFSEKFSDNILKNIDLIGTVYIRFPEIDAHTYRSQEYFEKSLMMDEIKKKGIEIKI